ncbi:MAG: hypothetical protein JW999_08470 [Methanotrichaceae archaeon]|nr:hypothetical protein [Methanotrichaceae archaeon]
MVPSQILNLTPAESLMLLDPNNPQGKRMIKLTFADLMLNGVLKAHIQEEKQMFSSKKRIYIRKEKISSDLSFKPHERIILDHIHGTERLDKLAREVYRSVGSLKKYALDHFAPTSL